MVQTDMSCSPKIQKYFDYLDDETQKAFLVAQEARKKGFDPEEFVEIKLAKNMAERVVGIISVVAPQIVGSGVTERIIELEKEYASQDWRVAFKIALEIAQEKFCAFESKIEAIEVGVRTGFAYVTVGVVSSPLEGLTSIEIKKRRDGKGEFFRLNYAGPIRNAGGTAAATSVLIADYVRKHLGYAKYDPDEKEVQRCQAELEDYHGYIANLQYYPFKQESEFLMQNIPVEIAGDASEKRELSNAALKDLPRVETNNLRSGYCLIHSSCIPLKAPKLWKQLGKWGHEMGMEDWDFLKEHIALQKELKSKKAGATATKTDENAPKIKPDGVFVADIVGGRPVLGHPMRSGGFRLRYGRGRASGYSGQSTHPASLAILNEMIATGTQLKVERPGKAAAFTPCDSVMGPIVKLDDGSVQYLDDAILAKELSPRIIEVLYLGDTLVNYGDFFDRAHVLVPPGYVEEYWAVEFEEAIKDEATVSDEIKRVLANPIREKVSFAKAKEWSSSYKIPLHPKHIFFYKEISLEELSFLCAWLTEAEFMLGENPVITLPQKNENGKRALELLGVPHELANEKVLLTGDVAVALALTLNIKNREAAHNAVQSLQNYEGDVLSFVNERAPFIIKDKSGVFIGARMGRPEKAKMRKLTGSPHTLFPVGEEGGRLRSFNAALEKGKVTADFPLFFCATCNLDNPIPICYRCGKKGVRMAVHYQTKERIPADEALKKKDDQFKVFSHRALNLREIWDAALKKMGSRIYPDLVKGVRGTVGRDRSTEHVLKGILRARNDVHVNKDGTVRYDASEITLTHFKPKEVGTSIERLVELGYSHDIHGVPLTNEEQVVELFAQDIVLPACPDSVEDGSDVVVFNTARFIDEELEHLYGMKPFYNVKTVDDIAGHLVIGLAPHTSAGIIGRIVGFSKTQGFLAHPLYHAAMRRDCFSYDSLIPIKKNGVWSIQKIGSLVESLHPEVVVDAFNTKEIKVSEYKTLGVKNGKVVEVPINNFTKHEPRPMIEIKTKLGRTIKTTIEHKHIVNQKIVRACDVKKGDELKLPYKYDVKKKSIKELDLVNLFKDNEWVMVHGLKELLPLRSLLEKKGFDKKAIANFVRRDSVPLCLVADKIKKSDRKKISLSAKRDSVRFPATIPVTKEFLNILGLYVAEGFSRQKKGEKGFYQVYIAAQKEQIRSFVKEYFASLGLKPSEKKNDRVTFSSRILYELFTKKLAMGSSAYEKRMPVLFLNTSHKELGYLLSGYLEGDGSVSKSDLRVTFDTVSAGLLRDIDFMCAQFGIFVKNYTYTSLPGQKIKEFYVKKNVPIPKFTITKGIVQSKFVHRLSEFVSFISVEKQEKFDYILKNKKFRNLFAKYDDNFFFDEVVSVKKCKEEISYCLNVPGNTVIVDGILTRQCDGDESCFFLLMDAFLNFSKKFLSTSRGSTMDAPLVLTTLLNPAEVDDMAFNVDIVGKYPLEFYRACEEYKYPWDIKMKQINNVLFTPEQFEGMLFTHDTDDLNTGVLCSSYKLLPSMGEKIACQMEVAEKVRAVDTSDVARLIIEKHFIRDTKGNLRKFSLQQFRCVACNDKYRRPPLQGRCTSCGGKVIFTISEGSVIKYLAPSLMLAEKYDLTPYLKQTLELTRVRIESYFGKEKEKQTGLGDWLAGA